MLSSLAFSLVNVSCQLVNMNKQLVGYMVDCNPIKKDFKELELPFGVDIKGHCLISAREEMCMT